MQHDAFVPSEYSLEIAKIQSYWDEHIHDLSIVTEAIGSPGFFQELDAYRYEKLNYLEKTIDFSKYKGMEFLEVGCGAGIDLARFSQAGANVTGIDLAETSIDLAQIYFDQLGLLGQLSVMNGEELQFPDNSFDAVYAHGVVQYTVNPKQMISEIHRVLKPGGEAILMVYNKYSWLNALSSFMRVEIEHADAPWLQKYSISEFTNLLNTFTKVHIIPERFPVNTRLHSGFKAALYNGLFVKAFQAIPKRLVRPFGWHLIAFASK